MEAIGKLISSAIVWGLVIPFVGITTVEIFGIRFNTGLSVLFSILSLLMPSIFDIGLREWKEANILEKILPLIYVVLVLVLLKLIGNSYATLIVSSLFIGESAAYIGRIVGSLL